jgi:hypothetical protein
MSAEATLQQVWAFLLQVGSLSGLIAGLSLVYTILLNRVSLRIYIDQQRVQRELDLIDLSIRVRNPSPRRDTSIESFYIAYTSREEHERLWSLRLLTLFEASSITEIVVDKKEAAKKIEAVGRNIRIRAGTTRNFRVLFSCPKAEQYSQMRFEGRWRRNWPIELVVETTHRDFIIPIIYATRKSAEDAERWFFEFAR